MDKSKEYDVAALKSTVDGLREENKSLKIELETLRSALLAVLQNDQQQQRRKEQQDSLQRVEFTPPLPDKYTDARYVTTEEQKKIKFGIACSVAKCSSYGTPTRFCDFNRFDVGVDYHYPPQFDGMTHESTGAFVTPVAGRYRFCVKGRMTGRDYKVQWFLCCARKEDYIFIDFDKAVEEQKGYRFGDLRAISYDKGTVEHDIKDEGWKEKEQTFNEKTRRHLLFTLEADDRSDTEDVAYVGVNCEKGIVFWTDLIPIKGEFDDDICRFQGEFVC